MNIKNIWQFLGLTQDTIGRRRFLIAFLTAQFGLPLATALLLGLLYQLFGDEPVILYPMLLAFIASLVFGLVVYIKISIRRVRDIGIAHNQWMLALIPFINLFFFVYLCLEKSGAGQAGNFPLTNLMREQFKRFFSHEFSKPFIIICIGVLVSGAIYAGGFRPKQDIDTKIEQRGEELNAQRDARQKQEAGELANSIIKYDSKYDSINEEMLFARRIRECLYNKYCASLIGRTAVEESTNLRSERYLSDKVYKELVRIKNTSSLQLFFGKLGFGWWGIIALAAALLINILIVLFKFFAKYFSVVVRSGGAQAKLTKTSIQGMSIFQRSLPIIALLILIILVFILIKL